MESEERRGRVPVELPTGDAAPGATVSHFSLFLPTPIHFPSPTFLIFTRESRGATVSPGGVGVRGGGEAGRRALGGEKKEKNASFWMPSLPASQSTSIHPTLPPSAAPRAAPSIFFFPPGCKMRQADGVGQAPPPTPCLVPTWEARRLIPALLINDIPITLWSH